MHTAATTSSYSRDLTRAVNLKINIITNPCGSEMLQDVPITSNQELWNKTKEYYLQQQDTDIGALITPYNWDSTDLTFNERHLIISTDAQHINIALNINGRN